ncbi:hypothetical protein EDC96DRAFT_582221 [Choanephora cucurbitarum]|nr:hypothetical protein EDC96DRAFT_582221 [Choanephora cucurbitarum]
MKRNHDFDALPASTKKEKRASAATYQRRIRKTIIRCNAYKACPELLCVGYGTHEECLSVLAKEYMSDDEDVPPAYVGITIPKLYKAYKVHVPSWRSEKLSMFFWSLDESHSRRTKAEQHERVFETCEATLTEDDRKALPSRALRS